MSDTDGKPETASVTPPWQSDAAQSGAGQQQPDHQHSRSDKLEVARRFLQEEHVKASSREKKSEFLKEKGLDENDIETLLGQAEQPTTDPAPQAQERNMELESHAARELKPAHLRRQVPQESIPADQPPIVTYPEFLVKPQRPPPLVTKNSIISTLYAFAGLSTILYGTSKFLVAPMVESMTDARAELHDVAARKLDCLVAQLEKTVSAVPSAPPRPADNFGKGSSTDDEDPAEMFHRDVGTQTSLIDNARLSPAAASMEEPAFKRHAHRLTSLTRTVSVLKDQFRAQSQGLQDVKTLLDVFRDDLDRMTYGGAADFAGGYDFHGTSKKNEPEDEIRKVRDNVRRIKGLLLSTRNFPVSTR